MGELLECFSVKLMHSKRAAFGKEKGGRPWPEPLGLGVFRHGRA
jgi:hypothetical protein